MKPGEGGGRKRGLAAVAGLGVLHFLLHPLLAGWWGSPHLVAAAVLVAGVRLRPGPAALAGFALGLLEEAMLLSGPGPLAAVYALTGYVSARSWTLFFADTRVFLPMYLVLGGWTLLIVNTIVITDHLTFGFSLLEAPVAAVLTAAAAAPAVWSVSLAE